MNVGKVPALHGRALAGNEGFDDMIRTEGDVLCREPTLTERRQEDQPGSHVAARTPQPTPLGFELSGIPNEEPSDDHPAFATGRVEGTCHPRDFDLIPRSHGDSSRAEVRNQRRFRYLE